MAQHDDTRSEDERTDRTIALHLAPFAASAEAEIDSLAGPVVLAPEARAGLTDWLVQRLAVATDAVLRRARAAGVIGEAADHEAWRRLIDTHADLGPLIGQMISDWHRALTDFFARYAGDAALLGEPTPALAHVTVVGGAWKRTPTLRITTGTGRTYFYKSHTMAIATWLMELVLRLNDAGLSLPLHARPIASRPGYGWDPLVSAAPCEGAAEAARYYARIGQWVRLFQALSANDLHSKNLIPVGEHPVPVDHENLLQPLRADASTALGAARRARQQSPIECGLLPHLLAGEPGRRAVDAGGLNVGGRFLLPFRTPDGYPPIHLPNTLPVVDGRVVPVAEGLPHLLDGFEAMHTLIAGPGAEVLRIMLPRAAELPVRVLRRPAHEQRRLVVDSLQPEVLAPPGARAALLARRGDKADLDALTHVEVPRHYERPALAALAPTRTFAQHAHDRDLITTAIGCAVPPSSASPAMRPVQLEAIGQSDLLRAAIAIGDDLLATAHGDASTLHWLGVVWNPWADARTIETLPNDLLSGNAGLAVTFAALHRVTREARFADAARRALAPVARALAARPDPAAWRPWGAYLGGAGQLYAVQRVHELLGLRPPAPAIASLTVGSSGGADLATGTAGLVAVGARLITPTPPWLTSLADVLLATLERGAPPLPYPDGRIPPWLPDLGTGITFALGRLCHVARFARAPAPRTPAAWDVGDAATLMARKAQTGAFFPGSGLADTVNLGGMLGVGAVALALLRDAAPELAFPSLWMLD